MNLKREVNLFLLEKAAFLWFRHALPLKGYSDCILKASALFAKYAAQIGNPFSFQCEILQC